MNKLTQKHLLRLQKRLDLFGFTTNQLESNFIDNQLIAGSGELIDLFDPSTGEALVQYRDAGVQLVEAAVSTAELAQKKWIRNSATNRGNCLYQVGQKIQEQVDSLAAIESMISGKPISDCRAEISKVAEMFVYYAGWCDKLHGEVIDVPTSHLNFTQNSPYGVVAQITPWNAPAFTCGWQVAPAIAAGNSVVLKPSEYTPFSSLIIAKLLAEVADIPSGLVNILGGLGTTTGQALTGHKDVNKIIFVGSPQAGRQVAQNGAKNGIPCVLELGGKSANIVFEDARLKDAIRGVQTAIFSAAGQSCVAGSRLLIQKSIAPPFINQLLKSTNKIVMGLPEGETTQLGPLQNRQQFEKVSMMIEQALAEGAKLLCGGALTSPVCDNSRLGYYIKPTILGNVHPEMAIAQSEVFGPVLAVINFEDEFDAVALANNTKFGLAGAVWTENLAKALRVTQQLRAGTIWINSYKALNVMSPFGGFDQSGHGRSSGLAGLHEYVTTKSIWVETAENPLTIANYSD